MPKEFQLSDVSYHLYENDNLFHTYGIELDSCTIEVSECDEEEGDYEEIDSEDFDVSNNTVPDEFHRIQYWFRKQYMIFESCEKGGYLITLKLDEPIDISKLKLKLTECIWDLDGKSLITGVIYDSEELEADLDAGEVSDPIITFYDEGENKENVVKSSQMSDKGKNNSANKAEHTSELSQVVTATAFEKAYAAFIDQADKNASSGKAQGSKTPYGFPEKPECDGAHFKSQYGQGTPSATPYMNWFVVSIYYLPNSGDIIMGIEEDRYPHLKEMSIKPLRYAQIGNKKVSTAVFYSTNKSSVDYGELHEKFISVCEEVMRLGLHDTIIEGENKKNVVKSSQISYNRNPILNSPDDITEELIQAIIDNDLDSLTINYEFTRAQFDKEDWDVWLKEQYRTNPFWAANQKSELIRIEFEIILGENVLSLACAFYKMSSLECVNLKDTSKVTNMRGMFAYAESFNQPIGDWNTSNVTNMSYMFCRAKSFNQPIGNWDTSNVTNMSGMFARARSFHQPIGDWDVSNVRDMNRMFDYAEKFNQGISKWDVSKVEDMHAMFKDTKDFNQPIGDWDTSNVKFMSAMFSYTKSFNQPIGDWDTSNVTDMTCMFYYAEKFNQPIGTWDISKLECKNDMFIGAKSYSYLRKERKK